LKTLQDIATYLCALYNKSFKKNVSAVFEYKQSEIETCDKSKFIFCETFKTNSLLALYLSEYYVCCENLIILNSEKSKNIDEHEACKWMEHMHQKNAKLSKLCKQILDHEQIVSEISQDEPEIKQIELMDVRNQNYFQFEMYDDDALIKNIEHTKPVVIDPIRSKERSIGFYLLSKPDYFYNYNKQLPYSSILREFEKIFFNADNVSARNVYIDTLYEPVYIPQNAKQIQSITSVVIGTLKQRIFHMNEHDHQDTRLIGQFKQTIHAFCSMFHGVSPSLCIRNFDFSDEVSEYFSHNFPNENEHTFWFTDFLKCDIWDRLAKSLCSIRSLERLDKFSITFGSIQDKTDFEWFSSKNPESNYQFTEFNNHMRIK